MHLLLALGLAAVAGLAPAVAQEKSAPPNFSPNYQVGWVGLMGTGPGFAPVPGRVPPLVSDPAHPFVPNGTTKQATYRIADLGNPNLKP